MPLGYGIKEESNPGGHLSQTEYNQMMEKKRAESIPSVTAATSQALLQEILKPKETVDPICRLCGQRKSIHHEGSTTVYDDAKQENVKVDALFCFKNSSLLQQFETLQPPPKDPRLEMEVVTRDKLASQLAQERGLVKSTDPVSIPNLDPEKMRTAFAGTKIPYPTAPTIDELTQPLILCANCRRPWMSHHVVKGIRLCSPGLETEFKAPADDPVTIKTQSKQAQIVTAIGLAKMVDDLKAENSAWMSKVRSLEGIIKDGKAHNEKLIVEINEVRLKRSEAVDKYMETRQREEKLIKELEVASSQNNYWNSVHETWKPFYEKNGFDCGRRSMDKWVVLSFGAGLILGIVGYVFIY